MLEAVLASPTGSIETGLERLGANKCVESSRVRGLNRLKARSYLSYK